MSCVYRGTATSLSCYLANLTALTGHINNNCLKLVLMRHAYNTLLTR